MKIIPLKDVVFLNELPVLLGVTKDYVWKLTNPPQGVNRHAYEKQRFPSPFYSSPSGIRVWFRKDVERWALGLRLKRTGQRKRVGIPLLDSPNTISELFGL